MDFTVVTSDKGIQKSLKGYCNLDVLQLQIKPTTLVYSVYCNGIHLLPVYRKIENKEDRKIVGYRRYSTSSSFRFTYETRGEKIKLPSSE